MPKEKGRIRMQRHVFDVYPKDSETFVLMSPEEGFAANRLVALPAKRIRSRAGRKDAAQRSS